MTTTLVPLGYKCPATLNLGVNMCLCSFSVLQTSYTHTAERDREGGILSTKSPRHFEPDGASRRTNQEMEETCCVRIVFCDTHATDLTQQTIIPYFWILFFHASSFSFASRKPPDRSLHERAQHSHPLLRPFGSLHLHSVAFVFQLLLPSLDG